MQKTYKVYLTKSHEVARLLQNALWEKYKEEEGRKTGFGCADGNDSIPSVYHGCGYFYAYIEYRSEQAEYALVFA